MYKLILISLLYISSIAAQDVRIVSDNLMACDLTYGNDCIAHKARTELIITEDGLRIFIKNKAATNGFIISGAVPRTRDNLYKFHVIGISSGKKYLITLDLDRDYFTLSTLPFDNTLYMYYFKHL